MSVPELPPCWQLHQLLANILKSLGDHIGAQLVETDFRSGTAVSGASPARLPWRLSELSTPAVAYDSEPQVIVDTFPFNGEVIAELRLLLLAPHVHRFYVMEAAYTHTGNPKPVLFGTTPHWQSIFAQHGDKVVYRVVTQFPPIPHVRFH